MNGRLVLVLISLMLLFCFLACAVGLFPVDVKASNGYPVHNLDSGKDFSTIQKAINDTETLDGHTILVDAGIYVENVVLSKSISLIGENKSTTIIDGGGSGDVVYVSANWVNVTGFTVTNGGKYPLCGDPPIGCPWGDAGIELHYVQNCRVANNNVSLNNNIGILLYESSNNAITGNSIPANVYGIGLLTSPNNVLRNNSMTNNEYNFNVDLTFGTMAPKLSHYVNDVDVSNTVDGKSIYYWVSKGNLTVPLDAGYVALVNCTNMTVQNLNLANNGQGLLFAYTTNSTVTKNKVTNNYYGIRLEDSSDNIISKNNMEKNHQYGGVYIGHHSSDNLILENSIGNNLNGVVTNDDWGGNIISGNNITNNDEKGVWLGWSGNNVFYDNNIVNNGFGVYLKSVSDRNGHNFFYHNNFIDNTEQVDYSSGNPMHTWDNGYPMGGNYWSDYTDVDQYSGPYQNETGSDGIWDHSYWIYSYNLDNYPLMGMFSDFNATSEHHVQTICNSSISDFQFDGTAISFNVSGENGTAGFCRVCIPTALMNDAFRVFVNGTEILPPPQPLPFSNSTHNYLYFTYSHSTQEVIIIPEFPSFLILPLFMMATLMTGIVYRKENRN